MKILNFGIGEQVALPHMVVIDERTREARRYGQFADFVRTALGYDQIKGDPAGRKAVKQVSSYFDIAEEDVFLGREPGQMSAIDSQGLETIADALKETCYLKTISNTISDKKTPFDKTLSGLLRNVVDAQIKVEPNNTFGYNWSGCLHIKKKEYEEAIVDLDKAIELDPEDSALYNNRGYGKMKLDRFEEAIADLDKAIELDPKLRDAYNNRGDVKISLEKFEEAIADLDKVIELDPKFKVAYHNRGFAKTELGKFEEALKDYEKAAELGDPFHQNLGIVKWRLGRKDEALGHFNEQIRTDPRPFFYFSRGSL